MRCDYVNKLLSLSLLCATTRSRDRKMVFSKLNPLPSIETKDSSCMLAGKGVCVPSYVPAEGGGEIFYG